MKKTILTSAIGILLLTSAFCIFEGMNWKPKEGAYTIHFDGGKTKGSFKGLKATILFDEANPEKSKFTATLDANTIDTDNGMRDKHAKSETALNTDAFPTIKFESTSVSKKDGKFLAVGQLTIRDVTKETSIPFTYEKTGDEAVFKGTMKVNPKDFHMTRGGLPDEVVVDLNIPVTKAQ